ncbi:MAG: dehydrogenase, partial [Bacteroidetes bacterium]
MLRFSPFLFLLAASLLLLPACQPEQQADDQPRYIEVLFLGHNSTHHHAAKYMPMLASALAPRGIHFTYTASPEDLNAENLALYDAVMIYANHDSITPAQEKALLEYVAAGHGFLPVHCASYCFRNSEAYIALVGAQFETHGAGVFAPQIVRQDHPITQGLQPYEAWDETYVHRQHNPDRTVLMERVEGEEREPWAWTRTHGKGRVFYTASGHDERVWHHPGFQELMFRAIVWSVGDRVKGLWEQLDLPSLEYTPSEYIANYEQRPEKLPLQAPLSQQASQKLIQVPPGFRLELFAKEPDIINPIAMAWDERGRLWVLETVDYPNEVKEGSVGDDRIKICEDTDGDGRADKFTVFADSLNIPTSLVFANGGVIISMAPHFYFLKDTDGDDKADVKEVLISGWGLSDTHAGPSNLKYGFDNQIWGTVGYSGFRGRVAGKSYDFGQAFYRFAPDASSFELMARTSNNTWGLGFSESFDVFGSTANNAHSWYMGIPLSYFEGVAGIPKLGSKKIAGYYAFHPITEHYRQVDVFGGFTAAAGHNLYTARAFPRAYWNRMAFICEPTGHLLAKGALEKEGAGFVLRDEWNMLASVDEWVSPVHAEVGPDGALWVADWYNFIIQHNPTPNPIRGGFAGENGKGNAHINPLRDRSHGRIYRIVHQQAPAYKPLELSKDRPGGLVKALRHDNLFWRLTAQRLLVERGQQDVLEDLYELVENRGMDEVGINGGATHALWT